ncbi:uncharacterized protein LOC110432641 [Sorghum bicolor]|uniref:uncharacterized protein LOC110432641 n=1 Tax=Sorghum bicolor TaxID=4558 RepID=UPI000B426B99|nr:uncharacterized protein LOC110432641 [Sorghum bicolor]|eukprot:XP_021309092.1 uncharacterized protein LOC110432641 [Sorghum bicolor]
MEKVLYASRQLQGAAQEWWKSYQYGRPNNAPPVTSREFTESFRSYHIPEGLIELKQEEVRALKQGSMTVSKYRDKFAQLSCYAPGEVAKDSDKQHHFLKGLYDGLQLQLMSNVYPSFQELVNRAIVIDKKRKEMDAKKRKIQGQASSSNTRPRMFPQQGFPPRNQRPPSQWNQGHYPPPNQNQNHQHPLYQQQFGNQQPQQQANPQMKQHRAVIQCQEKFVVVTSPKGDRICVEVVVQAPPTTTMNQMTDEVREENQVVDDFPDVFPDELLDALSRKSYVNGLQLTFIPAELRAKIEHLNIGFVNHTMGLEIEPTLEQEIHKSHLEDEKLKEIADNVALGKAPGFRIDDDGTIWFGKRICVLEVKII